MQITIREPISAFTHGIGMLLAIAGSMPLLINVAFTQNITHIIAISIFILSMVFLYAASTLYHSVNLYGTKLRIFKKIDHLMIFVLIAGTYTPICTIPLARYGGYRLLSIVWSIAFAGMLFKLCWVTCPKWISSVLYITLGWSCLSVFKTLFFVLSFPAFVWLLLGGIIYTAGGIIYALKLSLFNEKHQYFGSHEIFHCFVMAGTFCHVICMYLIV